MSISRRRTAACLLRVTQVAHSQWFFGNLYEAVVKVPDLLGRRDTGSRGDRAAGLSPLGPGSPLRYYLPAIPATTPAVLAAAAFGWDERASRSSLATAAACSAFAGATGAYTVRTLNIKLFFSDQPPSAADQDRMLRTWYRLNAARIAATGAALLAAHLAHTRLST